MVHLILLRHAKSDWTDEGLLDKDRPLNPRGKRAAPEMARWLEKQNLISDRILCSSAQRTRETLELMQAVWSAHPEVHFIDRLYLASPQTILEEAMGHSGGAQSLLIIGHNPGMEMLATQLSDEPCEMQTCTAVILEASDGWPVDWWDSSSWNVAAKHRA
jgi:phosphohistidine phosphatase